MSGLEHKTPVSAAACVVANWCGFFNCTFLGIHVRATSRGVNELRPHAPIESSLSKRAAHRRPALRDDAFQHKSRSALNHVMVCERLELAGRDTHVNKSPSIVILINMSYISFNYERNMADIMYSEFDMRQGTIDPRYIRS